ncbi:hypothetical protein DFH28DRAFT_975446 [Melampsora americana]|nr:hypothetical protein DFH28DRAFT_975446 [Melampsora americana]
MNSYSRQPRRALLISFPFQQAKQIRYLSNQNIPIDSEKHGDISSTQAPKSDLTQLPSRRKPEWLIQKQALKESFPTGWNPPKKISRPAMSLLKSLHKEDPYQFSLTMLSDRFKISPEAVRRILRSKWIPDKITTEKMIKKSGSIGMVDGGDAWIHHEQLETDSIPSNLASRLRKDSELQRSNAMGSDLLTDDESHHIWVDPDIRDTTSRSINPEEIDWNSSSSSPSPSHRASVKPTSKPTMRGPPLNRDPTRRTIPSYQTRSSGQANLSRSPRSSALGSAFKLTPNQPASMHQQRPARSIDAGRRRDQRRAQRQPWSDRQPVS